MKNMIESLFQLDYNINPSEFAFTLCNKTDNLRSFAIISAIFLTIDKDKL